MLRNLNQSSGGARVMGTPDIGVLAATIAANTGSGDSGPGLLYDESVAVDNAGKQLRCRVTMWPSSGNLFVYEDGSFDFTGAPNGVYTINYDVNADGVYYSSSFATISVGILGSANGVTLVGASSISAGAASGTSQPGSVSGVVLFGPSSLNAGGATGGGAGTVNGVAGGANLDAFGNLISGSPSARMMLTGSRRWIIGRRMDPKDPGESITVTFDFSRDATRVLAASISISEIYTSIDDEVQAMLDGPCEIYGTQVLQRISFGVSDVTYKLRCVVTDEDGERYVRVGELNVVTF